MKKIILLTIILNSLLFATSNGVTNNTAEKNLQIQIEKEKKFSQEQKFHHGDAYDLKAHEINPDAVNSSTLDSIPELNEADDDFDMDDVY